jgi:cytochrome oxidase assembly protein ShyY1
VVKYSAPGRATLGKPAGPAASPAVSVTAPPAGSGYGFLLTPRWLGLSLIAALAVPLCVWLGLWQLSRFETRVNAGNATQRHPIAEQAAVPLERLLAGSDKTWVSANDVGRPVSFTGRYDPAHQLLVPDRQVNGHNGFYVLTPMRLPNGLALSVVRGWAPGPASAAAAARLAPAPGGTVTATGRLQEAEDESTSGVIGSGELPAGQLGMISPSTLVNVLPYQVYDGWVALDAGGRGLTPVPTYRPSGGNGLTLQAVQNLGYTCQWFVFAGFAIFMWFRFVRREAEMRRDQALGLAPEAF